MNNYENSPPSPRQLDTLRAIAALTSKRGIAPTLRELGDELGIASTNGVSNLLRGLVRRGAIARSEGRSRATTITAKGYDLLGAQAMNLSELATELDMAVMHSTTPAAVPHLEEAARQVRQAMAASQIGDCAVFPADDGPV